MSDFGSLIIKNIMRLLNQYISRVRLKCKTKHTNKTFTNCNSLVLEKSFIGFCILVSAYLSDTGPSRGIMKDCYHNACDNAGMTEIPNDR